MHVKPTSTNLEDYHHGYQIVLLVLVTPTTRMCTLVAMALGRRRIKMSINLMHIVQKYREP